MRWRRSNWAEFHQKCLEKVAHLTSSRELAICGHMHGFLSKSTKSDRQHAFICKQRPWQAIELLRSNLTFHNWSHAPQFIKFISNALPLTILSHYKWMTENKTQQQSMRALNCHSHNDFRVFSAKPALTCLRSSREKKFEVEFNPINRLLLLLLLPLLLLLLLFIIV